jgi:hypothetical protein
MNWDYSTWDMNVVVFFVLMTIAIAWIFPAAAFIIFRYLVGRGQTRDPDEGISDGSQTPPADNPAVFPEDDWVRNKRARRV